MCTATFKGYNKHVLFENFQCLFLIVKNIASNRIEFGIEILLRNLLIIMVVEVLLEL